MKDNYTLRLATLEEAYEIWSVMDICYQTLEHKEYFICDDLDYVKDILSLSEESKVINLVGKTNLLQLKAVFEKSDILITPDSGSAHLGSAIKNVHQAWIYS